MFIASAGSLDAGHGNCNCRCNGGVQSDVARVFYQLKSNLDHLLGVRNVKTRCDACDACDAALLEELSHDEDLRIDTHGSGENAPDPDRVETEASNPRGADVRIAPLALEQTKHGLRLIEPPRKTVANPLKVDLPVSPTITPHTIEIPPPVRVQRTRKGPTKQAPSSNAPTIFDTKSDPFKTDKPSPVAPQARTLTPIPLTRAGS